MAALSPPDCPGTLTVHAESLVTMPRLRFHRWLWFAGLWLVSALAGAELHQVRDESLYTVFTALSSRTW